MALLLSYLNEGKKWNNADDIQHVVDDLTKNENQVTTLHFTGNTMGVAAAEKLTESLSKQSKIEKLLWSDLFTGRGKDEIGVALKAMSLGLMTAKVQLVELDLSDNAFGPNGVIGVTDLIASECCYTLKVLNMNNQGLGHQGCRALVTAMKTARLNSNKKGLNLEVFIAGRNRLENEGIQMLSEVFGDGMCSLKKLVLLQNGIGIYGIKGVQSLLSSIRSHTNLRILNISDNTIKANGMELLSEILPYFEQLEELYMDDCLLGKKGADILTLSIEDRSICPLLQTLSMVGNEIGSRRAFSIITAVLNGKEAITKVDLRENDVKKSKVLEIREILKEVGKEGILVEDDEVDSDAEEEDEESSDEDEDDEVENEEEEESRSQDGDEDSVDRSQYDEDDSNYNEDGECDKSAEDVSKASNTFDTSLFSKSNFENSNIFGSKNSPGDSQWNTGGLFGAPKANVSSTTESSSVKGIFGNGTGSGLFGNAGIFGPKTTETSTTSNGLFGAKTSDAPKDAGIFGPKTTETSTTSNGLFAAKTSDAPKNAGIFGAKVSTTAADTTGIFGAKTSNSSGLFGASETPSKSSDIVSGIFGAKTSETASAAQETSKIPVFTQALFSGTSSPTTVSSARTSIFNIPATKTSIFSSAAISNQKQPFSFCVAAKSESSRLRNALIACLQVDDVMTIDKAALTTEAASMTKEAVSSWKVDDDLATKMEARPDLAVRSALLLGSTPVTREVGVAVVRRLLGSPRWAAAANAVLVETGCLKTEDRSFTPVEGAVAMVAEVLAAGGLSEEVVVTLGTVLRTLPGVYGEDLARQLEAGLAALSL